MRRLLIIASFFCAGLSAWGQATYRYWFDRDETAMQTGTFTDNHLQLDIPTDGLSDWYHILHIQTQDDAGNWSPVISRSFAIVPASTAGSRDLTGQTYRYWFDRDEAGMKTGTLSGNNLVVDIPTDGLSDWFHILHLQTQDDAGNWSAVVSRSFAIVPASTAGSRDLTGQPYQYWFDDNFDVAVEGTMTGNVLQLDAAVEGLADGVHVFHLRTRDDKGNWCPVLSRKFSVGGNFGDILPWGTEEAWTAKYQFQSLEDYQEPANDASGHTWTELDYDDSAWETLTGPMSDSAPADGYNYRWDGDQNCFNLRRRFTLDEVSVGRYQLSVHHDDGAIIYLNGTQVAATPSLSSAGDETFEIPISAFKEGENLLAIYIQDNGGEHYLDYCLTCTPVSAFDLSVTASGNGTVSLVDTDVRGRTTTVQAKPKTDVTIAITPDRGNFIQSVMLDEEDVTNQLVDGKLTIKTLLANHTLVVTFVSAETMATVILPKGVDEAWEMKYVFTENTDNYVEPANDAAGHTWKDLDYDDSEWQTLTGPMGAEGKLPVINYEWGGEQNCFNLRRKFTLSEITQSRYVLHINHDDFIRIYINGKLVAENFNDWTHDQYWDYEIPSSVFVVGENILAIYIEQTIGDSGLDYSLTSIPLGPSDYSFTDTQGLVYSLDYQNIMAMVSGHTNALPEDITIPTTLKVDNTTWPVFGFMPSALADASLSSVHVEETNPYAIPANAFSNETFAAALMVPSTALDAYKRTAAWSGFDQIVPYTEGTLVPWGYEQPWTARYLFFEDVSDYAEPEVDAEGHVWSDETFDDSAWQTLTGPMANNDQFPVVNHTAMGENSAWLLRRTFHVNRLPLGAIHLNVMHDDDIRTYVNGKEIDANSGTTVPRSLIHEGDNTIAFYYHVITPPDYIDYSFDYLGFLPQEGDANNDATIDLGDLVQIVSHITGTTPSHFNLSMADVNKDGEVNAADLVALVSLMMGEGTEIAPARLPSLQTEAADVLTGYVTADGRLCFDLQAETAYTACQLTLSLPAGADIKDVRLAAERSGGHVVTTGRREDGRVVVLVYSTANRPFLSQNGLFLEGVAQMANKGTIDVEDILFVTPKGGIRHFDSFSIDLAAGVASVTQEQHTNAPTYDLAGRRVGQRLKKGIYIQKGRKKLK